MNNQSKRALAWVLAGSDAEGAVASSDGDRNAALGLACHRGAGRAVAVLEHEETHCLLQHFPRAVLVVQGIDLQDLFLAFVRLEERAHVFLADNHILRAVEEEDGQVEEVEMHHEVGFEDVEAHELLHLALHEVERQAHQEAGDGLVVVFGNIEHHLRRGKSTSLSLRKGVSRMRQKMWRG